MIKILELLGSEYQLLLKNESPKEVRVTIKKLKTNQTSSTLIVNKTTYPLVDGEIVATIKECIKRLQ